ncbi:hypothetical protein BN1356_00443 [Streptococcus varani]|uniref:Uncharacterized protein n=1 Tax=Streptococcus varani TaxID=1608583 RepID=A0A0E4H6W7_9STRE|nr:hypothetical protein BN1356_00443 [Streptococcus varani]
MKTNKSLWLFLLFVALILFLLGLNSRNYLYNILAVAISFIVYRNGYATLFKEYDDKQAEKRKKADKIYTALHQGRKKVNSK